MGGKIGDLVGVCGGSMKEYRRKEAYEDEKVKLNTSTSTDDGDENENENKNENENDIIINKSNSVAMLEGRCSMLGLIPTLLLLQPTTLLKRFRDAYVNTMISFAHQVFNNNNAEVYFFKNIDDHHHHHHDDLLHLTASDQHHL